MILCKLPAKDAVSTSSMDKILNSMRKSMPTDERIYELSDFFKILGDSTRARILIALENTEMCVQHMSELLDMSQSAISHQLKVLRDNNMVDSRREGKNVYYFLKDDHITDILKQSMEHICEEC